MRFCLFASLPQGGGHGRGREHNQGKRGEHQQGASKSSPVASISTALVPKISVGTQSGRASKASKAPP